MEVDTHAPRSTVSKRVYDSALSNFTLQHAGIILRSYSGEKILVLGSMIIKKKSLI